MTEPRIQITIPLTYNLTSGRVTQESGEPVDLTSSPGLQANFLRQATAQLNALPRQAQKKLLAERLATMEFLHSHRSRLGRYKGAVALTKAERAFQDLLNQLFLDEAQS